MNAQVNARLLLLKVIGGIGSYVQTNTSICFSIFIIISRASELRAAISNTLFDNTSSRYPGSTYPWELPGLHTSVTL